MSHFHILTFACPDKPGIVHAVTGIFASHSLNIVDLQQFSDPASKSFFMRVHFGPTSDESATAMLDGPFAKLSAQLGMTQLSIRPKTRRTRTLIMVSKIGHCLNDLLFRAQAGKLAIDVPVVVSNHADFRTMVENHGIEFRHLPVTPATRSEQEQQVLDIVAEFSIELVVLARYMQVLSPRLCSALSGHVVNIHHSFLPSFKGARPYHQAFDRGVKIIGATAHFVTADLDEGPIIEQRVVRVDHAMSPAELAAEGADVESQVLAAAVKWVVEGRVFLNGSKTVVFS